MELDKLILEYENDFFKKDFCDKIQNLNNRIHDEFIEYGKSGHIFNKNLIIEYLSNLNSDRDIEIKKFGIKLIKDDLVIANYISDEKEIKTKVLRTSIWIKENSDWQLFFHQGTPMELSIFK